MDDQQILSDKQLRKLVERFRVTDGKGFKLKRYKTDDPVPELVDKAQADALLQQGIRRLSKMQDLLYANATWSLLIVIQAMDAAGKDSTIKHVLSGVNPQGVAVTSFKQPSSEELAHDFLWRVHRAVPQRGMIGVFNRSHYEEVLITRVHPELLVHQHLPPSLVNDKKFWDYRIEDIASFERHLAREGTRVLKFFLNISAEEQKKRFLARLDEPEKNWKFSAADVAERGFWDSYMNAYQRAIEGTATEDAPWFVVPADQKWFTRLVVVWAINAALDDLKLAAVHLTPEERAKQAEARRVLTSDTESRS
jgi:PPK2 family polyphosphate:nucleotide phosphotransferase